VLSVVAPDAALVVADHVPSADTAVAASVEAMEA
jgi:hypothetical protein